MADDAELDRLYELTVMERKGRKQGFKSIAGIDEAGRGPLAGPVVAAACIIPPKVYIRGVDDSKKLTPRQREDVYDRIMHNSRIAYGIGMADAEEIDKLNIFQATIQAMLRAVEALCCCPDLLLVDGMKLPHPTIPCERIVGGDALSQSIAAASILAKVTRDRLMDAFHDQWPDYGFDQHKGYGTEKHRQALERHGPCPIHRRSFEPLKSMLARNSDLLTFNLS